MNKLNFQILRIDEEDSKGTFVGGEAEKTAADGPRVQQQGSGNAAVTSSEEAQLRLRKGTAAGPRRGGQGRRGRKL